MKAKTIRNFAQRGQAESKCTGGGVRQKDSEVPELLIRVMINDVSLLGASVKFLVLGFQSRHSGQDQGYVK